MEEEKLTTSKLEARQEQEERRREQALIAERTKKNATTTEKSHELQKAEEAANRWMDFAKVIELPRGKEGDDAADEPGGVQDAFFTGISCTVTPAAVWRRARLASTGRATYL